MSEIRQRRGLHETKDELSLADDQKNYTSSSGWLKSACISLFCAVIITPVIIMFIPAPIEPLAFTLPEPPVFEGPLQPNTHLQEAVRIYENGVIGPESIVVDGDHIYAGTADGKVVDIYKGEVRVLAKLGTDSCGSFEDEPTCGRPLGMRLDKDGYLIVADGYLGLFKINVATGDVFTLWPSSAPVNGRIMKLVNDLAISRDGTIYFTDSSTRWGRRHNRYCILEAEQTGRLIEYNPVTNTTKELATGLSFANGVQLSRSEDFLFVVETTKARIHKYHLTGARKGQMEVLIDNLPGTPDNIRPSSSGGYWVGMATARRGGKFSLLDFAAPKPWLRKLITKLVSQETIIQLIPKYGLIIEINEEGKILRSLHDPTGQKVPAVSEVEDKDGVLYLGSYNLPYMSKLYLRGLKS